MIEFLRNLFINDGTIMVASVVLAFAISYFIAEVVKWGTLYLEERQRQKERNDRWQQLKDDPNYTAILDANGDVVHIVDLAAINDALAKKDAHHG